MKRPIVVLTILILGLIQAFGCDSGGESTPDIMGTWTGSTIVPNAPFGVFVHYTVVISDLPVTGSGVYSLEMEIPFEDSEIRVEGVFKTVEFLIHGDYEHPVIGFDINDEDGRNDVFVGEFNDAVTNLTGQIVISRLPLWEVPDAGVLSAVGGTAPLTLTRSQ